MRGMLVVACGIPGIGKSTYIEQTIHPLSKVVHVSRDKIRFDLLKEGDDYFKYEEIVWKKFIAYINQALLDGYTVWADATHINARARNKLLREIKAPRIETIAVDFGNDIKLALERNKQREGRAHVPPKVIVDMGRHYEPPQEEEGFDEVLKMY